MSVILLGYRGCGKTAVGRKLADRLWQKFVDTDDLVAKEAGGRTIRQIFEQDGEEHFRDLETAAIREALERPDHVIALGGGAVLREENREMLTAAPLKRIYLRCEPAELFKRIQADPQTAANRPPLSPLGGSVAEIEQMLKVREPLYRQVMSAELDVTRLTVDEAMVYLTRMA